MTNFKSSVFKAHMLFSELVMTTFVRRVAWHLVNWELYMMPNNIGKIIVLGMTDFYLTTVLVFFCSCLTTCY
jgi:hypothetical protein